MDYEKKYNEAFERAKDYFKANQRIGELDENDVLSGIFPELKEPEEKMRDWLEKKGEQQQELTPDHWQDVRERAAIAAMQSYLSFGNTYKYITPEGCADNALRYADALVEKLKGE